MDVAVGEGAGGREGAARGVTAVGCKERMCVGIRWDVVVVVVGRCSSLLGIYLIGVRSGQRVVGRVGGRTERRMKNGENHRKVRQRLGATDTE